MSEDDRRRWDARYAAPDYLMGDGPKALLRELERALPTEGAALDVAAGEGQAAVWLARRGLVVDAVDISARGLAKARALAGAAGVSERVRCLEHDLDLGLPAALAPAYTLVTCLHFRPRALLPEPAAPRDPRRPRRAPRRGARGRARAGPLPRGPGRRSCRRAARRPASAAQAAALARRGRGRAS